MTPDEFVAALKGQLVRGIEVIDGAGTRTIRLRLVPHRMTKRAAEVVVEVVGLKSGMTFKEVPK